VTGIASPACCEPHVAHGSDDRHRPVEVWLHSVECPRPPEERRPVARRREGIARLGPDREGRREVAPGDGRRRVPRRLGRRARGRR
jgi:hypothetical protein